ncbi:RHS repeat protein [Verrucomicrobia bacterium S94]|nr:RHS repeat protein [Verrucomicrobia bacterium S94]
MMKKKQVVTFLISTAMSFCSFGNTLIFTPADAVSPTFEGEDSVAFSVSNFVSALSLAEFDIESPDAGRVDGSSLSSVRSASSEAFSNASSVIEELAYALEYNPTNIYEFVRNQIHSEFYVGNKRSPERVIQDGAGNDCDQASLLIALLEASGYGASYNFGAVILPVFDNEGCNLSTMLNVDSVDDAFAILSAEQLPVYYYDGDTLVNIAYTWVTLTNGSEVIELDTFFKPYEYTDGVGIDALSSYVRSNLYAEVGGVVSNHSFSGFNEDGLYAYLTGLTTNLCAEFRSQLPNGSPADFFGDKHIVQESGLNPPRFTVYSSTAYQNKDDLPTGSQQLGIYAEGEMHYISLPDLGTRTVYIEINDSGYGRVLLGDEVWVEGSIGGMDGGRYVVPISIVFPIFTYSNSSYTLTGYDSLKTYTGVLGAQYAFPIQFNDLGNKAASAACAEELAECLSGAGSGDPILLGLQQLGTDYFHLQGLFRRLSEGLYGKISHQVYAAGVFIQSDYPNALCDVQHGADNLYTHETKIERTSAQGLISSALEHGIWEQNQPGWLAVSSVRGIAEHCRKGGTVFRVTADNFASVEAQLSGYTSDELDSFEALLTADTECLILPDTPVSVGQWTGIIYLGVSTNGGITAALDKTNGGAVDRSSRIGPTLINAQNLADFKEAANIRTPKGADPVDMASGNYLLEKTDLTMDGPMPLVMKRNYSSGSADAKTALGYGWNHSFNMYVQEHTSPDSLMDRSLEDIAGAAVAYQAMLDILQSEDTARSWTVASLIAEWAVDRLAGTAVTVYTGQKAATFVKQPDGSFTPPEGMTVSLTETNGVYVMQERHGNTYAFNTNGLIDTIEDPYGNTLTFEYSGGTNLNSVQSSFGPEMTFSYTDGLLTSVSDNAEPVRTVYYQYDSDENLTNVVDAAGFDWSMGYDSAHQITWVRDPENITLVRNAYNSVGQVTNQISASGHRWLNRFIGNCSIEEDPLGNQTKYYFDSTGRTWSEEKADGSRTYTFFDGQGHITGTVNERGVTNRFVYDTDHNLLMQVHAEGTAEQTITAYAYDSEHHLRLVTNAVGTAEQLVTEYAYTDEHAVDYTVSAKGSEEEAVTDYSYTAQGLLRQLSEGNGKRITVYSDFDSYGNAQMVTSTDAGTVSRVFNAKGDLKTLTVGGKTTAYGYDDLRQLIAVTNALGTADQTVISKAYYGNGLLRTSTDARGKTSIFYWTPAYKPAGTLFPDGGSSTNLYDEADRLVMSCDPEGSCVTNTLDSAGRPVSVSSMYSVVTNQFDTLGNLTNSVVDPSGLQIESRFVYDSLGRMTHRFRPIGYEEYQMDGLGRVTNRVDAASKEWKTEFDALGRVKNSFRPSGVNEEYGYDDLGNRTVFRNAEGKPVYFGVDAQGRVTAITNAIGKVTAFTYDAVGNLDSRIDAAGVLTEYGYDALNRLTAITNQGVEVAAFDHDANGNIIEHASPHASCTFGYDEMNRLVFSTQLCASVCSVVENQYDLNGNRTNIVYPGGLSVGYHYGADNRLESVTTEYAENTESFVFNYDSANRLTGMDYPNGVHSTFGYDAESRITSIQHGDFVDREIHRNTLGFKTTECINAGIKSAVQETARRIKTHNDADQLIFERVQQGTNWTDVAYSYSDNGCLTNITTEGSETQRFGYDYDNRIVNADGTSCSVEYLYDATGARIGRICTAGVSPTAVTTNYFIIDYTDGLKRPLAETDSAGSVTRYYIWAGMRLLAHIEANGDAYCYHQDELGSTLALTDESGAVTDQFAYMPYGAATRTGSTDAPFQWLGGYGVYYDIDTELHLTLHRAYSCSLKRFIGPDPLGIDGGVNIYMWANMNPLFFVDPYGLAAFYLHADNADFGDMGHGWFTLENDAGERNSYGLYPKGGIGKLSAWFSDGVPASIHKTSGDQGNGFQDSPTSIADATLRIPITQEQYDKVQKLADGLIAIEDQVVWSKHFNCVDYVQLYAAYAGINFGDDLKNIFGLSTPNQLEKWINEQREKQNVEINK